MEKIYFDDSTYIWKTKLNKLNDKQTLLSAAYDVMNLYPNNNNNTDAYSYPSNMNSEIDKIINIGIDSCKSLYSETGEVYNKLNTEVWVNVVRSKKPLQPSFIKGDDGGYHLLNDINRYHTHTEIKKLQKSFYPHYTFVYYIQMPDVMDGEDGVLYIKGEANKEYWIRPEEDDLIIMEGSLPHNPNTAPKSTIDRVVIASNIGFELVKTSKSII